MYLVLGQNLDQIRSNILRKVTKQALAISCFHILQEEYFLKQKVVVVQTSEYNFMVKTTGTVTFEER